MRNRTLIIDNMGHELDDDRTQMSGFDVSTFRADGGRTWLSDNRTQDLDEVHMLGCTHLAISPDTGRSVMQTLGSASHSCGYLCVMNIPQFPHAQDKSIHKTVFFIYYVLNF